MSQSITSRATPVVGAPGVTELFAWSIPIGAAAIHFVEFKIDGKSPTGWLWLAYLFAAFCLYQVEVSFDKKRLITMPVKPWLIWFGFVWLSLAWCPGFQRRNLQDAMMITMPLPIGVLTSMVFRHRRQLERLHLAFAVGAMLLLVRFVWSQVGLSDTEDIPGERIIAITACLFACVSLAYSIQQTKFAYGGWLVCLSMAAGSVSRMGTGIMMLLPIMNPNFRNRTARWLLVLAMPFAGLAVFYSPAFQERFFYSGEGTITDVLTGNFLSFGRLEAWPSIFAEAAKKPWLGHGVGTVVEFVPTVWEEEDKPHNEYLRVFYECGIIGVILFVYSMTWQITDLFRKIKDSQGITRITFAACIMGWLAFAMFSVTDNVIIYGLFYGNLLFAMMGAAYGVASAEEQEASRLVKGADR